MKKNIGTTDSLIRIAIAALIFYFIDSWDSRLQLFAGIFAAALVFTALNRVSLLYFPFKISTKKNKPE